MKSRLVARMKVSQTSLALQKPYVDTLRDLAFSEHLRDDPFLLTL